MAQVKIYGIAGQLVPRRAQLSDVIHECVVEALQFPRDKRAHRFFPMERENFFMPAGRTDAYTLIEITMIAGRSVEARKKLVRLLFERVHATVGIAPQDLEICIQESAACNWGFRGQHGDEIQLNYRIEV
jgi:5-carboxymethyl-2-hydroxymuconate isomerase